MNTWRRIIVEDARDLCKNGTEGSGSKQNKTSQLIDIVCFALSSFHFYYNTLKIDLLPKRKQEKKLADAEQIKCLNYAYESLYLTDFPHVMIKMLFKKEIAKHYNKACG